MKFSTIFAAAASLLTVANAAPAPAPTTSSDGELYLVELITIAKDVELRGKYLSAKHEGAGINYIFLASESSQSYLYNTSKKKLVQNVGRFEYDFNIQDTIPQFSVLGSDNVDLADGYLNFNGSIDGFAACKNINDPYHYSESEYALTYYGDDDIPDNCKAIQLAVSNQTIAA